MADWKQILDSRLELTQPVSADGLGKIPAKRGIILLQGQAGEPVQLLTSANLRNTVGTRLTQPDESGPTRRADLGSIVGSVRWKLTYSWFETDLGYKDLVCKIWPDSFTQLLGYKPAWFVHVDPTEKYPHFYTVRNTGESPGQDFGPFASGKSAQRFIESLTDGFDLCRYYQCLRRSPNAQPCMYAEMGRCLVPCDGRITMDQYRHVVAQASKFASGIRAGKLENLRSQMSAAAGDKRYEQAAQIKARGERLDNLSAPEFKFVAPGDEFRFIFIQRGPSRSQAKVFFADRWRCQDIGVLGYTLEAGRLNEILSQMSGFTKAHSLLPVGDKWHIALITHYLYYSKARRGLIVRFREGMDASALASAVKGYKDQLALLAPKPKRTKKKHGAIVEK